MKRRSVKHQKEYFGLPLESALMRLIRPFQRFSPTARLVIGTALLAVVTTLLLAHPLSQAAIETYREGDIVRRTVVAPTDITAVDIREQERLRAAAIKSVRSVFRYESPIADATIAKFRQAWLNLKQENAIPADGRRQNFVWPELDVAGAALFKEVLRNRGFAAADLEQLTDLLRREASTYIYADEEAAQLSPEIRLIDTRSGAKSNVTVLQSSLRPLSLARQSLEQSVNALNGWSIAEKKILASTLPLLLKPTIVFDRAPTDAARNQILGDVPAPTFTLKRTQVIAREGDTVTPETLTRFAAVREHSTNRWRIAHLLGLLTIVGALYWTAWKFTEQRSALTSLTLPKRMAFLLVVSAVTMQTVIMSIGFVIADSVSTQSVGAVLSDPTTLSFAIPFAAASLLVTMLVDSQLGLLAGLISAFFAGLLAPDGVAIACYAMASSSASIYGIKRYRDRQSVTVAGAFVGLVNAGMALAVMFFLHQSLTINAVLASIFCGFAGGLLTTIFSAGGLPINESFFGILTDVKLLELSNADLPVLGQLALRAPGTNQHSHAVGQLAEDACRAIGANSLLARIGALYHDIGKLAAPDMFIENQQGANPHDRLRPSNSARIITSHVPYGLKLAKELHIPKQIADFIAQHHGTRTLHYFLRKAQAQAAPGEVVDESEFRYPGPKPQFKETAIMMVADSCEAAARSLARPDPENVRAIVTKIIDAILSDGQLDECDLTLRELKLIRETVITSLIAIHHARVDYPGFNPPREAVDAPFDTVERGVGGAHTYLKPSEVPIDRGGKVEGEAVSK